MNRSEAKVISSLDRNTARESMTLNRNKSLDDELLQAIIKTIDRQIMRAVNEGLPSLLFKYSDGTLFIGSYSKQLLEYYSGLQYEVTTNKEGIFISWI